MSGHARSTNEDQRQGKKTEVLRCLGYTNILDHTNFIFKKLKFYYVQYTIFFL